MLSGFTPSVSKELIKFVEKHHGHESIRKIAVFDADGTLWRGDVGEAFFRYQVERRIIPHAPKRNAWNTYFTESTAGDSAKAYGWLAQWNAGVKETDLQRWCEEYVLENWIQNVFEP